MYEVSRERYNKLLKDNVTKAYKTAPAAMYKDINREAKSIAQNMEKPLDDRMDTMAESQAFLTFKDHKDRFANDLPCRLINPAKAEMGTISKTILDRITTEVTKATDIQLWKNTASVLDWFRGLDDKKERTFVCFDIVSYYPSITEDLLRQALRFAAQYTNVSKSDVDIIMHARRSLLFDASKTWVKKDNANGFDVTMGSYDGAEVCQLVGALLLNKLATYIDKPSIGLYRDDGLATLRRVPGWRADKIRKNIIGMFQSLGLKITIDVNRKVTDFLDVTLNLETGTYKPYRKPGDTPLYLNRESNHPPIVIKNLPQSINKRLTSVSANQEVFEEAAPTYAAALSKSGFNYALVYNEEPANTEGQARRKKNRKRTIIWFNPPYSQSVKTDVGATFLRLVKRHFPEGSALRKIFNKNTLKVSYSCSPNLASIIKGHNAKVLRQPEEKRCNCRVKANCPLNGDCNASEIVYEATVDSNLSRKKYIGISETPFKLRFNNHTSSFRNAPHRNSTELSKHAWALKEAGEGVNISWRIRQRSSAYKRTSKRCNLCLSEKIAIMKSDKASLLNTRCSLVTKCRHSTKYLLSEVT